VKETYQLVSIRDGKQDLEAILQVLREIKAGKRPNDLKLLNYYNEVPISYAAKIDKIESDCIECTVHQAQSVVFSLQKQTLLTSSAFPQGLGVHSYAEYVNVKSCFAVLGRFVYATIHANRRAAVRVKVDGFHPASYLAEEYHLSGRIFDISVTGIAMQADHAAPAGLPEHGAIHIAINGADLAIPSSLVKVMEIDGACIYCFKTEPDKHADKEISHFIYSRQVEIIRQLKEQFL
jgi:c-di-GMP-binding flagellar brake protein YcgR